MLTGLMQTALRLVYPPRCLACGGIVETDQGLCGPCWGKTPFISGTACDLCGVPLPGESDRAEHCDDCLKIARPWKQGRAALCYAETARKLVLALKHGDRLDLVEPLAKWMARAARPLIRTDPIVLPVPLHRWRLLARRYNQSALLAETLAQNMGLDYHGRVLIRHKATPPLDGLGRDARFATVAKCIAINPEFAHKLRERPVLIVDDVMTSGATFAACAETCHAAGASEVFVLALARVAKDA